MRHGRRGRRRALLNIRLHAHAPWACSPGPRTRSRPRGGLPHYRPPDSIARLLPSMTRIVRRPPVGVRGPLGRWGRGLGLRLHAVIYRRAEVDVGDAEVGREGPRRRVAAAHGLKDPSARALRRGDSLA